MKIFKSFDQFYNHIQQIRQSGKKVSIIAESNRLYGKIPTFEDRIKESNLHADKIFYVFQHQYYKIAGIDDPEMVLRLFGKYHKWNINDVLKVRCKNKIDGIFVQTENEIGNYYKYKQWCIDHYSETGFTEKNDYYLRAILACPFFLSFNVDHVTLCPNYDLYNVIIKRLCDIYGLKATFAGRMCEKDILEKL